MTEEGVLQTFEIFIRDWFKDVTLLLFSNSSEAWQELYVQTLTF